jgi:hypothetical protein
MTTLLEQFGPDYPDLGASVAKYRRKAKESIFARTKAERDSNADAIENAIRAKQRSALQRELPSHRVSCASGTDYSDGREISAAVRQQHRSALQACPSQIRRARAPHVWEDMYNEAMAAKRGRESQLARAA